MEHENLKDTTELHFQVEKSQNQVTCTFPHSVTHTKVSDLLTASSLKQTEKADGK